MTRSGTDIRFCGADITCKQIEPKEETAGNSYRNESHAGIM